MSGAMQTPLRLHVGFMRCFGRGVRPKINELAVQSNGSLIGNAAFLFLRSDAKKPRSAALVSSLQVLTVFGKASLSKIGNPVVIFLPVNVVNELIRPFAVDVKPSKPMRSIEPTKKFDFDVSVFVGASCLASFGHSASTLAPSEHARFGAVVQKLFQSLLGKCISGLSHVIAPHQRWFGQGLGGVGSTLMPRSIIGGAA